MFKSLLLIFLCSLFFGPSHAADAPKKWNLRTVRMEGAAVNVNEAAEHLSETANKMVKSGQIALLPELISDSIQLNQRVLSAVMAAEVLNNLN